MLVVWFVLVLDPVLIEPIRDHQLFEALHLFSLQSAQVQLFDVGVVIVLLLEIPLAFCVQASIREPADDVPGYFGHRSDQRDEDVL